MGRTLIALGGIALVAYLFTLGYGLIVTKRKGKK